MTWRPLKRILYEAAAGLFEAYLMTDDDHDDDDYDDDGIHRDFHS